MFSKNTIMCSKNTIVFFFFYRYFQAETRLKDDPFSHSRLYTSTYKPAES
jgi:hypothetical protein